MKVQSVKELNALPLLETAAGSAPLAQPEPGEKESLIQLRGVVKSYSTAAGEILALQGVDLDIYPGEYVGIIGKSGAGKSTLINMITGIDRITSGQVKVGDVLVHDLDEDQRALWRGRNLGVVYQFFQLMPTLTILDNVLLPMDLCGNFRGRQSMERAMELLQKVELQDHAHKKPSAISGGQQQRVAIARALANDPPILIADEPTGRLDQATAEMILQIFDHLAQDGKTVLVATHDHSQERRVGRMLQISDGKIVMDKRVASSMSQKSN
jgi:putative ABC transport system ATP-binding protein